MKMPLCPPKFKLNQIVTFDIRCLNPVTAKGEYIHWDKLRHLKSPEKLTNEQLWNSLKLARKGLYKELPLSDNNGFPFVLATPDVVLQKLHIIDHGLGNPFQTQLDFPSTQHNDSYLIQSLMDEAITSSQLEGAAMTRKAAKEMLRTNRKPRDLSEKMIYNNYQAMQFIHEIKKEELTFEIILELHRILTKDTLDDVNNEGCLRTSDDIYIYDNEDQILHTPPKADQLSKRLRELCQFANTNYKESNFFIHPVVKAILMHFKLAYDHPFVDGNGRTARALFYWSMIHEGYPLVEYISISEAIKRAPVQYLRAYLYTETDDNDVTYFIIHQLDMILLAIQSLHTSIEKQKDEIKETEELLDNNFQLKKKLNYRQIALLRHALKHANAQYLIEVHRQFHNVTYDTARNDLLTLAKYKLLIKEQKGKAFCFIIPNNLKEIMESSPTKSGR